MSRFKSLSLTNIFDFTNYYAPLLCSFLYQLLLKIYNPFICLIMLKQSSILWSQSRGNYLKVDIYQHQQIFYVEFFFDIKLKSTFLARFNLYIYLENHFTCKQIHTKRLNFIQTALFIVLTPFIHTYAYNNCQNCIKY